MSGARILVVDDEPQILRFLRPALEASGYEVLHAETGREALRMAANARARSHHSRSRPSRHGRQGAS